MLMKNSSNALLSVINDILDYSKIEAGKLDIEQIDINLRQVMEELSDIVAISAFKQDLFFDTIFEADVPVMLKGDPVRLSQILMNFCGNAVKFTRQGGIVLRISSASTSASLAKVQLKFSVTDTGIGIPKNRISGLFQSFSQMDSSMTRQYGGTGLGLSISKQLTELMGGQIGVSSQENKGSTFWSKIEFQRQSKPDPLPDVVLEPDTVVLIADANPAARQVLVEYIKPLGCAFQEAFDIIDACSKILSAQQSGTPFSSVFFDRDLPGMPSTDLVDAAAETCDISDTTFVRLSFLGRQPPKPNEAAHARVINLNKPVKYADFIACMSSSSDALTDIEDPTIQPASETFRVTRPCRLLLAEDDEMNRIVAENILKRMNLTDIQVAENGQEAVDLFKAGQFDLILMDGQMPVMSGLDATVNIRAYEKAHNLEPIPIVALTAHAMKDDRAQFLAKGMDDYLTKPLTVSALADVIKRTLPEGYYQSGADQRATPTPVQEDEAVVDMTELREIMNANKSLLDKCTQTFKKNHGPVLTRIMDSIADDDGPQLRESAHQLKGMLKYLAAKSAAQTAYRLEQMGESSNIKDASPLIGQLQAACKNILDRLENISEQDGFS